MTKNSILQLVGQKQDIHLFKEQAKSVEDIFSDGSIPPDFVIRLKTPSMSFKKSSIRLIEVNSDTNSHDALQKGRDDFYEEERTKRKRYLSWTKEKLASYTHIFEGLYKISSGKEATDIEINKAREIQLNFFKENTQRTLCDLYLFKPIIPMTQSTTDIWQTGFFRLAEKAVFRDMELSGQLKTLENTLKIVEPKENETISEMKDRSEVNRKMDKEFSDTISDMLNNF